MTHYTINSNNPKRLNFRSLRYRRQKISAMLASNNGHAVKNCMLHSAGNKITVMLNSNTGHACYSGLMTCGSVWDCPICSAKISSRRGEEIKISADKWKLSGGAVVMVTYTIRHNLGDSLKTLSNTMTDAIRYVHSGLPYKRLKNKYKIAGTISATEILFNPTNGWHYHKHQLLFIKSKDINTSELQDWLFNRYNHYLNNNGFDVLPGIGVVVSDVESDVLPEYIAKWGLEDELTSDTKNSESLHPFQLLDNEKYYHKFIEYSNTMMGKRRLTWSKGLRDLVGLDQEQSDLELASELSEDLVEVINIEPEVWRYIVINDLRSDVLDQAELRMNNFIEWFEYRIKIPAYKKLFIAV